MKRTKARITCKQNELRLCKDPRPLRIITSLIWIWMLLQDWYHMIDNQRGSLFLRNAVQWMNSDSTCSIYPQSIRKFKESRERLISHLDLYERNCFLKSKKCRTTTNRNTKQPSLEIFVQLKIWDRSPSLTSRIEWNPKIKTTSTIIWFELSIIFKLFN